MNAPSSAMPDLEYLLNTSINSLKERELASLNRATNLERQVREDLNRRSEELAIAIVMRWLIDNRDTLLRNNSHTVEINPDPLSSLEQAVVPVKHSNRRSA